MPHDQPVIPVTTRDNHQFELIHVRAQRAHSAMLFLPGMGMTSRQYIGFAQAVAREGIEVFIHEWRGLGSSSLRASRDCDWGYRELLELDLSAALEQALEFSHARRMILAGHSLGSQLACLLAGLRPEQTAGIVIIAGGAPHWRSFPLWMGLPLYIGFWAMPTIASAVGHYPGRQLGFAGREARRVMADWALTGRSGSYTIPGIDHDLEAALARLEIPVLALRMEADWFVPEASLQLLLDKMPNSPTSIDLLTARSMGTKADHYNWMQAPDTSVRAISRWHGWMTGISQDRG